MDILNTLKSVLDSQAGNQQPDLMSAVLNLVGGQSGGLDGFIQQFATKGLGDIAQSWVRTGMNLPISPDQLQSVLGSDVVKGLASKLGMDNNALTSQLSTLLPQVVDKLTPDGKIPTGDIVSQGMNLLGGLFGKK
ncbi:MAG: hypothetical protein A2315_11965 [Ignavibacteria bacterium RIFOXYB2_FULL_35_12]|nr:MAG: hypothetical protein A2058_14930 [Ignavibacteria bacterium GWA2_36_19]OGU49886.1 MAG: hypothetical protein A2006_04990 [Ignavibacteria bacterium GWC2_35_8]OGU61766.1 MAG: hypothetical protein A2X60_00050 [Ignavibacteria bacterium GWF2_35_20]OGU78182.1 MAG: hypothetical protein A2254_11625 [Ignavibacteria bacterium RIFOXYA2_FULL_35_9]OGU85841.1 MAG: hypothetical protein A3K31_07935 [Ignavibacteria bacterium RIFOXYA12_FULL_35_25]OGU89570.1 MAG: hypothetical protein A2492_11075 [Ignavibac